MQDEINKICTECEGFCPEGTLRSGLCLDCEIDPLSKFEGFHPGEIACTDCLKEMDMPYPASYKVTGQKWHDYYGRYIVINRWLCEQHIAGLRPGWKIIKEAPSGDSNE